MLYTPLAISALLHFSAVAAITVRVIMVRPAPGVAFAWLFLVIALPIFGVIAYLLIGERRIAARRSRGFHLFRDETAPHLREELWVDETPIDWSAHPPAAEGLDRLGRTLLGNATHAGNDMRLHGDTAKILEMLARDIDDAETGVLMAFYIWSSGGDADEVAEALIRAARRGVTCRVLVDAIGSRPWLGTGEPARLRDAGVDVQVALRTGPLRAFFSRAGLRLHRKIVVVDGRVAWAGSMNLVDPRFFKQDAGVGEWIDAMVRMQGPAVTALGVTVLADWMLETVASLEPLVASAGIHRVEPRGPVDVQVVQSGPGESGDALLQMLLNLIYAARTELVLTTPYLVPDESILRALRGAAARGVRVVLILPARVDSLLARYASRSYYDDLLEAGIEILLYGKGLLHTKSITVDASMSMFGSVNLDMRSLWLNYEVALFVYHAGFAGELRRLQGSYADDCVRIDPADWSRRALSRRFLENLSRLLGPIL